MARCGSDTDAGPPTALTPGVPAVRDGAGVEDKELLQLIAVDSTSVRAHQHAAGAPTARSTGTDPNYTDLPGESAGHAVGRSRGGWTSRIHALADQACSLTTLQLTVGRTGNNHALAPLLAAYRIEHQGSKAAFVGPRVAGPVA